MRTVLRGKLTLLFLTCAVVLAIPAIALADIVSNNIDNSVDATAESRSIAVDGSTTVGYFIQNQNTNAGDTLNGCNTDDGTAATVTINTPANSGVTATPGSLTFSGNCGVTQNVSFTATKAGIFPISVSVSDSGTGTYSTTQANWILTVTKANTALVNVSGSGHAGASDGSLTATLKNTSVTPNKNVSGKTVTFKIDGNDVPGSATTDANGVATLNNVDLSGFSSATTKPMSAHFAGLNDNDYAASSGSGTLTVAAPLCTPTSSVTTQPTDQTVTYGANSVSFTAAANGSPAPGVQWQVDTGSGFTNIQGATNGTLTINNPAVADSGKQYRAVFTNTCNGTNSVTSNAASLTVNKAHADLSFAAGTLSKTYNGDPQGVTVNTSPSGLSGVEIKYDGSTTAPTNAGSYAVVATLNNPNYEADELTGTLVIAKAHATLTLGGLTGHTYSGSPQGATVTTSPAGLNGVSVTYNGNTQEPTNAGSYAVVASLDNPNYEADNATGNLVIDKKSLTVTAEDKQSTFNDANLPANTVTYTNGFVNNEGPGVLDGTLSYKYYQNGNEVTPQNAGTYAIRPSGLTSGNYAISFVDGTLTIGKANQTISFATLPAKFRNDAPFTVSAQGGGSGNPVTFAASGSCTMAGNTVTITGVGSCTITASQAGNANYNDATPVSQSFGITYKFDGFRSPVDNPGTGATPVFNTAKAGSAIPVKFSLTGNWGLVGILNPANPVATTVTCPKVMTTDLLEETVTTTSNAFNYDATLDQYNYVWKTQSTFAGKCYKLDVKLNDGTSHVAYFNFTK